MLTQSLKATVPRASDWFAWHVALTQSVLLVGSPGDASSSQGLTGDPKLDNAPDSGSLYMYGRHKDQWVETAFIKSSNSGTPDGFGDAVAVHGNTIAVTAAYEASDASGVGGNQASNALAKAGAAYIFR